MVFVFMLKMFTARVRWRVEIPLAVPPIVGPYDVDVATHSEHEEVDKDVNGDEDYPHLSEVGRGTLQHNLEGRTKLKKLFAQGEFQW